MTKVEFKANVSTVRDTRLVRLPNAASSHLPSRGLVIVNGVINGYEFQAPLEPDGRKGHWLNLDQAVFQAIDLMPGDEVELSIEPSEYWPEPAVPSDLQAALDNDPKAKTAWEKTTPAARWDWIRSVRSTKNPETRARRIKTACDKLRSGKPRQCCFNRSECTFPELTKAGVLLDS